MPSDNDKRARRVASTYEELDESEGEGDTSLRALAKLIRENGKKMDKLSIKFDDLTADHKELKKEVDKQKVELNETQQDLRNSSLRISGLKVGPEHRKSVIRLLQLVHEKVFAPILQGAVDAGEIMCVPEPDVLLEYGHLLPQRKKSASSSEPILVRFHSRVYRSLIFRYKRQHLKELNSKSDEKVFLTEHLTQANYAKLRALQEDPETEKVWTLNGKIKFTTKTAPETVVTVKNPFV